MNYGARAKDWITDHDVKQKKLAQEFHVTEAMLSNYLNGRNDISVELMVKIAQYFHLTMDYLVGLSEDPDVPLHLTKEERDLIGTYRFLLREQRELIVQTIQFMQEQNQR
ncbi:MAG: helix-turn-helix transcriptional regulator [Lawsonibacter sp.]|nr:helix-turn-helix transcriptional regulator [Lawsonibacter sp.]